ncbi:MAG: hypothetical protein EHM45_22105, partial [Desulfobacteraceae bacterium]
MPQQIESKWLAKIKAHIKTRQTWYTRGQLAITRIPAPTFRETERGMYMLKKFRALGLARVQRDTRGNVLGLVRGSGREPALAVTAHLGTGFIRLRNITTRRDVSAGRR